MTSRYSKRHPRYYDGPLLTSRPIQQVLPQVLEGISKKFSDRPDLIVACWPEVVGQRLAPMTKAVSFVEGVLTVKVNNSTLHSLLSQNDKPRLIKNLRDKFPGTMIRTIVFRLG